MRKEWDEHHKQRKRSGMPYDELTDEADDLLSPLVLAMLREEVQKTRDELRSNQHEVKADFIARMNTSEEKGGDSSGLGGGLRSIFGGSGKEDEEDIDDGRSDSMVTESDHNPQNPYQNPFGESNGGNYSGQNSNNSQHNPNSIPGRESNQYRSTFDSSFGSYSSIRNMIPSQNNNLYPQQQKQQPHYTPSNHT